MTKCLGEGGGAIFLLGQIVLLRKKISQSSRYGLFLITHYMWQSRVEIKDYSVVYFDRIVVFEVLYC